MITCTELAPLPCTPSGCGSSPSGRFRSSIEEGKTMAGPQSRPPVGSIWTVRGVENGHALVILGPIMREKSGSQFVVVPIYSGQEQGFGWSDQDVRLESEETSYAAPRFLGVWNARAVYERELERFVMRVPDAHIAIAI